MHHGAILDVAVRTDVDQFVIAAQHGAEPDTGPCLQAHFADQGCSGRGPTVGMGFDPRVAQTVLHACFLNVQAMAADNPLTY
ncbi:hypothetical protein D3C81_1918190 [compost metagenome]